MTVPLLCAVNSAPDNNVAMTREEICYGSKMAEALSIGFIIKVSSGLISQWNDRDLHRTLVTLSRTSCRSICAVD